ncbi:inhibitory synaptic factor 2A [Syngnathus typhle]|uniref:inhibitory synaptic factor 2A n=1 Tax=Syngnathus typhle TaxID=161592 RepID=UPI002A69B6D7|nr:inhibitory synaptic factor 2A [Syngnathus typhle]
MVSKEGSRCVLTNSESDSEAAATAAATAAAAAPLPSASLALQVKYSLDAGRQVRKRNKALQVRFKDICEAQNEQREAELAKDGNPLSYKAAYRKYMTVPARRSIPNVTRSTGVQTSPDLKKRYQTFPFERKKGHTLKHVAAVETYRGQDNGFAVAVKPAAQRSFVDEGEEEGAPAGSGVWRTKALLHTNERVAARLEQRAATEGPCEDTALPPTNSDYQLWAPTSKALAQRERRPLDQEEASCRSRTLPDRASKVTGPIAWNSLTEVECLDSPSARHKRKKSLQLNGLQSETLPRAGRGCVARAQCHAAAAEPRPADREACKQIVPMNQDGEVKAQLEAMENLISSSQETIKVLLGVIQELEKGEAHREGLSYRTGQDTANCDTCRNSACIIYSVELDFKQQEDKLQPLMKRLCPSDDTRFPALPYPHEAFTSTPKRKSKAESKKHARWRLWFM